MAVARRAAKRTNVDGEQGARGDSLLVTFQPSSTGKWHGRPGDDVVFPPFCFLRSRPTSVHVAGFVLIISMVSSHASQ